MKLSRELERICKERGLNLSKIAKATGVPIQTLHGWTEGRKAVRMEHLKKVSDFLRIPIHQLMFGEKDPYEYAGDEVLKELFTGDVRISIHRIERIKTNVG